MKSILFQLRHVSFVSSSFSKFFENRHLLILIVNKLSRVSFEGFESKKPAENEANGETIVSSVKGNDEETRGRIMVRGKEFPFRSSPL